MFDTQITLTGWIGGDVTLREVAEGRHVASFRVACTPTRYRDGEWVKGATSWHTVKAWNRLGRHVAASLHSGDPVVVHGRLVDERGTHEVVVRIAAQPGTGVTLNLTAPPTEPMRARDEYARNVRAEYAHVPEDAWRRGRPAVLQRFLDAPVIHPDPSFRAVHEPQARANLEGRSQA